MTLAVPSATELLGDELPLEASVAESFALARVLHSVADDTRHARQLIVLSLADLGMLRGEGLGALMTFLTEQMLAGCATVVADVEEVADHLGRFARTCETLNTVSRRVLRECEAALSEIRSSVSELSSIATGLGAPALAALPSHWRTLPTTVPPEEGFCAHPGLVLDPTHGAWVAGVARWREALEEIHAQEGEWARLVSERTLAEHQLGAVLDGSRLLMAFRPQGTERTSRYLLTRALTGLEPHPRHRDGHTTVSRLTSGALSARQVAGVWHQSSYASMTDAQLRSLPPEVLFALAGVNGIPAAAQNVIARAALGIALQDPGKAHRILGFAGSTHTLHEFQQETLALSETLALAEAEIADYFPDTPVQLIGLGNHDDALTATLVIGDLDTASHVGVNVSGMFSDVEGMGATLSGARNLFHEAVQANATQTYAVAHWIGYRAPGMLPGEGGVLDMARAQAGGHRLSEFLDGIRYSRAIIDDQPVARVSVFGHSYGSTTVMEALKMVELPVDDAVTYGSAGVDVPHRESLNARSLHVTSAKGDGVAGLGIIGSGRVNPLELAGVHQFAAEGVDGCLDVTSHSMYAEPGERTLLNPTKTGYLSAQTHTVTVMGSLLAGVEMK